MISDQLLGRVFANRSAAKLVIDKACAEEKLIDFIRLMWPILEPGRAFVEGWAVEATCDHLEAVSTGQIKRLLINVPPGCMKSMTTNVFWPAWTWGPKERQSMRFIGASYADSLSIRDNRKCRILVNSPEYQALWGDRFQMTGDQNEKRKFENDRTGWKMATSVGGVGAGERGDVFICDDPHNTKDVDSEAKREDALQWFTEVVPTRLNDDKSAIVVIMQRVHERDVSGHILAEELGYDHLCLPMEYETPEVALSSKGHISKTALGFVDPRIKPDQLLWPERFSAEVVERDKKVLSSWGGSYAVSGQFQQRPVPRGGGMFQTDDFGYLDEVPELIDIVRGWDLAATKDGDGAATAGLKMGFTRDRKIVILDVRVKRASPGEVEQMILNCAESDGPRCCQDIPQDPGQAGKSQVASYRKLLRGHTCHFSPESGSKEDRARPLAAQAEIGNLYLIRAPWNDAFVSEATSFPRGRYKDQIDAASRAYARLVMKKSGTIGIVPPTVVGVE